MSACSDVIVLLLSAWTAESRRRFCSNKAQVSAVFGPFGDDFSSLICILVMEHNKLLLQNMYSAHALPQLIIIFRLYKIKTGGAKKQALDFQVQEKISTYLLKQKAALKTHKP